MKGPLLIVRTTFEMQSKWPQEMPSNRLGPLVLDLCFFRFVAALRHRLPYSVVYSSALPPAPLE